MITIEQLKSIASNKESELLKVLKPLNDTCIKFHIDTPLRKQHFIAQICHESLSFIYRKELASGKAYEGRKDLGNVNVGDGVKFKGRGYIQITGRSNYSLISKDLGIDFISKPELLEEIDNAILSAGWFWNKNNLNILADKDDINTITKRINGGLNGFEDRKKYLEKAKKVII